MLRFLFALVGMMYVRTENITDKLLSLVTSKTNSTDIPWWVHDICPEVVDHFINKHPYFDDFYLDHSMMTTVFAAKSVCTMKILDTLVRSMNGRLYLHAGSHLGAILHAGPIPWDDDVDMITEFRLLDRLLALDGIKVGGVSLHFYKYTNALKIWIDDGDTEPRLTGRPYSAPFVDLFFFKIKNNKFHECYPDGSLHQETYELEEYFPTHAYYFGGYHFMGPRPGVSTRRYDTKRCVSGGWNHRFEKAIKPLELDCGKLERVFPFFTPPPDVDTSSTLISISIKQREEWARRHDGDSINKALSLDEVELVNDISNDECPDEFRVLVINAETGFHWQTMAWFINNGQYNLVLLNEMDVGMARTDQQHTTKLLAQAVGMNYAWGVEFIELTNGNRETQERTRGQVNFQGFTGNAILSKHIIKDATLFRSTGGLGDYFSNKKTFTNANGYEKRLGGRMGIMSRICGTSVGTVHKVTGRDSDIRSFIGLGPAIVAGDQDWRFCKRVGLHHVDDKNDNTWPATCSTFGTGRGDIVCSNSVKYYEYETTLPCVKQQRIPALIQMSDHAFTSITIS